MDITNHHIQTAVDTPLIVGSPIKLTELDDFDVHVCLSTCTASHKAKAKQRCVMGVGIPTPVNSTLYILGCQNLSSLLLKVSVVAADITISGKLFQTCDGSGSIFCNHLLMNDDAEILWRD